MLSSWCEQQSLDLANEGIRALQATATNLDNIEAAAAVPHDRLVQVLADARLQRIPACVLPFMHRRASPLIPTSAAGSPPERQHF